MLERNGPTRVFEDVVLDCTRGRPLSLNEDMRNATAEPLSAGGVVMIVVAAIGLFSAFTMIICLLALSRRRVRAENQIETLNRPLSHLHPFPPRFDSLPTQIRIRSLFGPNPSSDPKFEFRPPSYEEAMRMGEPPEASAHPLSNTLTLPVSSSRAHSPPPAFTEVDPLPRSSVSAPACNELVQSRDGISSPSTSRITYIPINSETLPHRSPSPKMPNGTL